MGNFGRKLRPLHKSIMSAGLLAKVVGKAYQSNKDHPRREHEHGENSRDECRGRLLRRAESVFDRRLGVVMNFLWVWDNGL